MAGNPLQQMIPQVLQQLMQNPQMLQQLMQQAGPLLQMAGLAPSGQTASDATMMQGLPAVGGHIQSGNPVSVGRAYPLVSGDGDEDIEQSYRDLLTETGNTIPSPPSYPPTPALPPNFLDRLQRPPYNPADEDTLQPGEEEPIARLTPGLLTRLAALSMPAQMMPQSKGYPITKDDIDLAQGDYLPDTPMDEEEEEDEEEDKNYKGGRG